jgi:hypothetical protein
MNNKNYPNMFDDQMVDPKFLDSLTSIAKEPLSHKIRTRIQPLRVIVGVAILLFYGNTIFNYLLKIYFNYAEQINTKIINIQIASAYAEDVASYLLK